MTRHGPALLALSVLAIAGWTYNVNYDTRAALDRLSELRAKIAEEREALQVLRVEWAWLNAPGRLTTLVAEHNERLALMPLTPDALGYVAAVPYPPDMPTRPLPPVEAPEALIAAAPRTPEAGTAQAPASRLDESSGTLLASAAPGDEASSMRRTITAMPPPPRAQARRLERQIAGAGATGTQAAPGSGSTTRRAAEPTIALAAAPAAPPPARQGGADRQLAQTAPAVAQKAAVLTQRAQAPSSMEEAVALALVEAGVLDANAAVAIIPASAGGGASAADSRPPVWIGR